MPEYDALLASTSDTTRPPLVVSVNAMFTIT